MSSSDVSHVIGGQLSKEWSEVLVTYCVIGGTLSVDLLRPHHFGGLVTRLMLLIMLFVEGVFSLFRLARALSDSILNWSLPKNIISSGLSLAVLMVEYRRYRCQILLDRMGILCRRFILNLFGRIGRLLVDVSSNQHKYNTMYLQTASHLCLTITTKTH